MSKLEPKNLPIRLQEIADREGALIMSFVASERAIRKSPVTADYVSITMDDLYSIESKIDELKEKGPLPEKLLLVIHTPGGLVFATTKIAKYLQSTFKGGIEAYVPYEASSGGTILCLAARAIVLDDVANLTPIDPQVPYKNLRISAVSYQQAINDFSERWGKYQPGEIPSPYQQMARDFDPILEKQMKKIVSDAVYLAFALMNKAQNPKNDRKKRMEILRTAVTLVNTHNPHGHIIDRQEAEDDFHLPVMKDDVRMEMLGVFKQWVRQKFEEESSSHVIECYAPQIITPKSIEKTKASPKKSSSTKAKKVTKNK